MADLVVGMAKSVVNGALTKAQAAIEEEDKLQVSAQRNLVFITGEFQMMLSFLNVADRERLENVVVRTWVRQIRDLAYDVEDCIEFVVHLDKRNRWWIRMLHPGSWFMPCLAPPQLDEAVAELERLKARVDDVSARNSRYSLISDSGSKPAAAVEQPPASGDALDKLIVAAGTRKARLTYLLPKEGCDALRVISVWGTGGGDLGMTSIVWDAYTAKETCERFACRAWVKLRRPFNPHEFIGSLTAQFFASTCQKQAGEAIALDDLKKMVPKQDDFLADFAQHVNEKRFLIVLEDLSNMEEWNAINSFFPKGRNGSCIIVSTLHFEVASLSVGYPYHVLLLNQTPAQNSVYAFYKLDPQHDKPKGDKPRDPAASSYSFKREAAKMWTAKNRLVGRESEMKYLNQLASTAIFRSRRVMSVWGIAGVGKSALIKHLFCDKIFNTKMYMKYAWVDLSQPFNLWDLSRSLLFSFDSQDIQTNVTADHGAMGSQNPIVECREMLRSQRCLVVLDGLQSTKEWDLIQAELLSGPKFRSFAIVISSEESIITHCDGPNGPLKYNVKGLEHDVALRIFREVSGKENWPADVEPVLQELVSKCGGLPKFIVEIAGLIAKMTVGWQDLVRSINSKFMQELKSNARLQGLFSWMESYFRNCPDSLKPCIFYLSIFCPNQLIRRRRLLRRWVAEGYSRDSHEESAEENGEKQFFNLLGLGIIQRPSSVGLGGTRMISCQINNGFFREYIVSERLEDNHVFELDGKCTVTSQRTGRHLVITEKWDRDIIVFQSIDFSKLRSLTVLGKWESFFASESMKLLRVLDLEDATGVSQNDLKRIVKCFPRLKFLSLRGCSDIYHLPSSVCDLRQLQTLDVRGTSIVTLPANITKLQSLQYIRAAKRPSAGQEPSISHLPLPCLSYYRRDRHLAGIEMPPEIGKLTALHTLGVVKVNVFGSKAMLEDLKKLTQLRKLGVSGINKNNIEKFFSAISALVHLESLSVRLDKGSQGCLEGIPLPLGTLRSLKLHGLGDKLPAWSHKLTKLTKIDLDMDKISKTPEKNAKLEDLMMFLGTLPELCILRLCAKQFEDNKLNVVLNQNACVNDSYKKVKILELACSSSSNLNVTFGSKTMKELEQLKVDCSSESKYQFSGLENLAELKEVCLKGPNANRQEDYMRSLLVEHKNKPVLKLE